ncbi:MAG: helix-turn-helix transcriptional regulator [Victivallales bacterium]|nr:helix-turn-helix transcriptional regulator [Victivallales bacterium]
MTALKKMVKARNIKQATLASKLGVSKAAVSMQIKKGIKTVRTANRYGEALGCNPLFLLDT